jgi:hypothetical protein
MPACHPGEVYLPDALGRGPAGAAGPGGLLPMNPRPCRLATNAALAAYTYSAATQTITITANGALANIDGVAPAVGDKILLTMGAAAADNGIYVVTSLGGASAQATLQRHADLAHGDVMPAGFTVEISEGTVWSNNTFKDMGTGAKTIGTTSLSLYPRTSRFTATLVAGTVTVSANLFVFATTSQVEATINTQGGTTTFISAPVANRVAGVPGTGAIKILGGGSDTSTVDVVVTNW